jgi:hypothetical protein
MRLQRKTSEWINPFRENELSDEAYKLFEEKECSGHNTTQTQASRQFQPGL